MTRDGQAWVAAGMERWRRDVFRRPGRSRARGTSLCLVCVIAAAGAAISGQPVPEASPPQSLAAEGAGAALPGVIAPPSGAAELTRMAGMLGAGDERVRDEAARGLREAPLDPEVVGPVLAQWLRAEEPVVRTLGAQGLVRLGLAGIPFLEGALDDPDAAVRWWAAAALGTMGAQAERATPLLADRLEDPAWEVSLEAALSLLRIGAEQELAVRQLVRLLGSTHDAVRQGAASAIARLDQERVRAVVVPGLTALLVAADGGTRLHAARALVDLKQVDARVVEVLIECLNARDAEAIWQAQQALGRLDAKSREELLLPALLAALRQPDRRLGVAEILPRLGRSAVPGLTAALADADPAVRFWAADILGRMSTAALGAIPALLTATRDPDRLVRDRARSALLQVSPDAALVPMP